MAYATPDQYVQAFGLAEATQLLQDEERELDAAALATVLAGGAGAVDAVTKRALDRLTAKLANTSNFMDGYLRNAIALPLAHADPALLGMLCECCVALTRCLLADDSDNATERMDKCCADWKVWLKDVAAGRVKLVDSAGTDATASPGKIIMGIAPSGINWAAHRSFGGGYRP